MRKLPMYRFGAVRAGCSARHKTRPWGLARQAALLHKRLATTQDFIALIDSDRLDYYHQLERERIHLLLIDEVSKGLDDVAAGRGKMDQPTLATLLAHFSLVRWHCEQNQHFICYIYCSCSRTFHGR
jgi:hypothetical protein